MRRSSVAVAVLCLATLGGGCHRMAPPRVAGPQPASPEAPAPAPPGPAPQVSRLPASAERTQHLFRVRYEGPRRDGSLRLTLRLADAERFQITTADTFGRALWSLDVEGDRILLIEHRAKSYCRAGPDLVLPEVALAPLPLHSVPRALLGLLPVPPAGLPEPAGELDYLDRLGRRWTAVVAAVGPESWTLWEGEQPTLWWRRRERGGVLSHREGIQFRWQSRASEALSGELAPLVVPPGFAGGECS